MNEVGSTVGYIKMLILKMMFIINYLDCFEVHVTCRCSNILVHATDSTVCCNIGCRLRFALYVLRSSISTRLHSLANFYTGARCTCSWI